MWCVRCDMYVIEHDGNVLDAAMLAMLCALQVKRGHPPYGDEPRRRA